MLRNYVHIRSILIAFMVLCLSAGLAAATIKVDANAPAGGNGIYWSTAFNDLQDALAIANFGDSILVAAGVYVPTDDGNRAVAFQLVDGVTYLGGFTSTDTLLAQRDWLSNSTVLSGDLSGDGSTTTTNGENSYSVIYTEAVGSLLVFDGFIITGGNAEDDCFNGSSVTRSGGGWYNNGTNAGGQANPSISNCKFVNNMAGCSGGAMFNNGTDGGMATPNYEDVSFEGNFAFIAAGAIYNSGHNGQSSPSFLNCKFLGNHTDSTFATGAKYAGAMYNFGKNGNSNVVLVNCVFNSNYSFAGGAVYNLGNSNGHANPTIINCTFYNNQSVQNGGACYVNAGDPGDTGEAVGTVINTIYYQNSAGQFGGDIFRNNFGSVNMQYCLVDKPDCSEVSAGDPANCLSNMYYNADPLFVAAGSGDLTPDAGSPAINAGLVGVNGLLTDCAGNPRNQQGQIDIGALESPFAPLPIEMISFTAQLSKGITQLDWVTESEQNNDYFEVQRSSDGISFSSIGTIKGSLYSTEYRNYQFLDKRPMAGTNYYRLKQVDYSRAENFSPIRSVDHHETYVQIFPNPAIDVLSVSLRSATLGKASYHIYNLLGEELQSGIIEVTQSIQTEPLILSQYLEAGSYYIFIDFGSQQNQTFKFIKARD